MGSQPQNDMPSKIIATVQIIANIHYRGNPDININNY